MEFFRVCYVKNNQKQSFFINYKAAIISNLCQNKNQYLSSLEVRFI